ESIDARVQQCFEKDHYNLPDLFTRKIVRYLGQKEVKVIEEFDKESVFDRIRVECGLCTGSFMLDFYRYGQARVYKTSSEKGFFMGRRSNGTIIWGQPVTLYHFAEIGLEDNSIKNPVHVFSLGKDWVNENFSYPFPYNAPGLYLCDTRDLSFSTRIISDQEYEAFEGKAEKSFLDLRGEFGLTHTTGYGITHTDGRPKLLEPFRTTSFSKAFKQVIDKFQLYEARPQKV
ncbi:MAG: hypothetical protein GOU97_01055, partial [Nanoarchaeota archaeon]|nr:hypothetical protein [Nanoarchaeota archaeon]